MKKDKWEGFQGPKHEREEGFFARHTRAAGPPNLNLSQTPFKDWDWQ